ncbi:MAG: RluA family pseudouridine synthase [Patescibacteria group bacterium]
MNIKVLYEDNHLIAVYKPAGVLVQDDITGDESLMDQVKKYLKEKYQKPGNVFLGLVHRLDRPVSGVVLFAKTSKGAARVSEQFRERAVAKTYHAWVEGVPAEKKATLNNYIVKDENMGKAFVYDEEEKGSLSAVLSYEVVGKEEYNSKTFSCLKISLGTGRFHQIRAQLAHMGHPIAGDFKYGALRSLTDQSIKLCATSLEFVTATTDERKIVSVDVPPLLPLN